MTSLVIRRAIAADLPDLESLCIAHARFERGAAVLPGLAERLGVALFGAAPRLLAWVAVDAAGGVVVGFASASPVFSTWAGAEFLHLDCLYLVESARGRGGGRQLLAAVRAEAVTLNCGWLEWQTPEWNAAAIAFYERCGASHVGKRRFSWQLRGATI